MERPTWHGGTLTTTYRKGFIETRAKLADFAYFGQWDEYFRLIESFGEYAHEYSNYWRLRAPDDDRPPSGYTALHQAAYHPKTPVEVVEKLLKLGAWRLLRTTDGANQTPLDIAKERGNDHLIEILTPQIRWKVESDAVAGLQKGFEEVVMFRVPDLIKKDKIRLPSVEVLMELDKPEMFFPVPGFYGGFILKLTDDSKLKLESFCRVWGGSGQEHVVKPSGTWKCVADGLY